MNTLTIYQLGEDFEFRVKTIIMTSDGVEIMEVHRKGMSDSDVLADLLNRNYFQHFSGPWSIHFNGQDHVINRDSMESAVTVAQVYIQIRDDKTNFLELID